MIVFDLDGTLANCEHRRRFVDPEKCGDSLRKIIQNDGTYKYKHYNGNPWQPDWKAFHKACDKDEPIVPVIALTQNMIETGETVSIWSGRCESVKDKTEQWLEENGVCYDWLKMRPIGDYTPDDHLKERWLNERCADHVEKQGLGIEHDITCVFEDRPKVIRMWRRRGIFVFNCAQNDEEL